MFENRVMEVSFVLYVSKDKGHSNKLFFFKVPWMINYTFTTDIVIEKRSVGPGHTQYFCPQYCDKKEKKTF